MCFGNSADCNCLVISIPVAALWNIQLQFKKKLLLIGILSLAMITILFSIIRIAVMPNREATADTTWLCLWGHVETGVGKLRTANPLMISLLS
jgi:hypothetical protein